MSSIEISPVESQSSSPSLSLFSIPDIRRNPMPTTNSSEIISKIEKIPLKSAEKQVTFEVKTDTFNRKIQVKTKQEDTICRKNQISPTLTFLATNPLTAPKNVRIERAPNSTSKTNFLKKKLMK
jgi:hypothetical protein